MSRASWSEFTIQFTTAILCENAHHHTDYSSAQRAVTTLVRYATRTVLAESCFVRHFPVLQIPPLRLCPSFSSPAYSSPANSAIPSICAKLPEVDDRLWKCCINNSSTERFAVTTNAQKHLITFPGGKHPPCGCPCLRHASVHESMQTVGLS